MAKNHRGKEYDERAVEAEMQRLGKMAAMRGTPALELLATLLIEKGGLAKLPGKTPAESLAHYAEGLESENLNQHRQPFQPRLDDPSIRERLGRDLGLGADFVDGLMDRFREARLHDKLMRRRLETDYEKRQGLPSTPEMEKQRADKEDLRSRLENAVRNGPAQAEELKAQFKQLKSVAKDWADGVLEEHGQGPYEEAPTAEDSVDARHVAGVQRIERDYEARREAEGQSRPTTLTDDIRSAVAAHTEES